MTLDEARIVAEIVDRADGGCRYCARDLREELQERFPQFDWGEQQGVVPEVAESDDET
jgi:hypothetical protein